MTKAAEEINEAIEEHVAKFPELQAEYNKLTAGKSTAAPQREVERQP